jgi:hypothetical protein
VAYAGILIMGAAPPLYETWARGWHAGLVIYPTLWAIMCAYSLVKPLWQDDPATEILASAFLDIIIGVIVHHTWSEFKTRHPYLPRSGRAVLA